MSGLLFFQHSLPGCISFIGGNRVFIPRLRDSTPATIRQPSGLTRMCVTGSKEGGRKHDTSTTPGTEVGLFRAASTPNNVFVIVIVIVIVISGRARNSEAEDSQRLTRPFSVPRT
jgi:hypothetical protein